MTTTKASRSQTFDDVEKLVDRIIDTVGPVLTVGAPLGLGKANRILEALYTRARSNPEIELTIHTALGLVPPDPASDLEARLRDPISRRLYATIPEPQLFIDLRDDAIPDNVTVHSFFFQPGAIFSSGHGRRNRINANYSDVERRLDLLGLNVFVQLVAPGPQYSLSCNPDLSLSVIEQFRTRRAQGDRVMMCAEINRNLPWMGDDAAVDPADFDAVLETPPPDYDLFSIPNLPLDAVDHAIGAHAAALIADGGTLQLGIGSLSDAVVWMLCVRHRRSVDFARLLRSLRGESSRRDASDQNPSHQGRLVDAIGGTGPFRDGLYGASEMLVHGFLELMSAGILSREVDGRVLRAGFFVGPRSLYERLRAMPADQREMISMTGIDRVNSLDENTAERMANRPHARFVNAAINVALDGSVASDMLDDGRVVSGVGGQFDFVEMARRLPGARSIIVLPSVHDDGTPRSNIVVDHRHVTNPGHLRDIVITEYGVADLRNRSDGEVAARLIEIADSRFQAELVEAAKSARLLTPSYELPAERRRNTPQELRRRLRPFVDILPNLPFDSDLTDDEITLGTALRHLDQIRRSRNPRLIDPKALTAAVWPGSGTDRLLERMGLAHPESWTERIERAALAYALAATGGRDVVGSARRPDLGARPTLDPEAPEGETPESEYQP